MPLHPDHYAHWMRACARGKLAEIDKLAMGGPWPDLVSETPKASCLLLAAGNGHVEVCKRLLAHQPHLEARNDDGATSLIVAAQGNHGAVVDMLLAAGVDALAVDNDGRSALYHATRDGNAALVRKLIVHVPAGKIDQRSRFGETPLSSACHALDPEIITLILERGANPNQYNEAEGERVMKGAILLDNAIAVRLLAQHGARLGHMHNGEAYLHTAVRQQCEDTVRALLEAGANPMRQNRRGQTPGDLAAEMGWRDYARISAEFEHAALQARTGGADGVRRVRL